MNKPRKRTELLLAAAALLLAAGVLLAAGARSALASAGPDEPPGTAQRANPFDSQAGGAGGNPFEAPQPGVNPSGPNDPAAADSSQASPGSYVVGYTGIVVYQPGEAPLQPYDGEGDPPPQVNATQPPPTAPPPVQQQPAYPVNLNTATQAQLETLPGIGPVKAQAILAWRAANGGFTNANQLLQVSGIGQKTLDGLAPYVTW